MSRQRADIDWEAVRQRLKASQMALDASLTASPERLELVYRERAAVLANRQEQVVPAGRRVLVFELGLEPYGLDFSDVRGVLPFEACTPIPGGQPELLGMMNIRGEIRSVIDLRRVLGLPTPAARGGYVLLVGNGNRGTCLRVDAIDRIRLVPPGETATLDDGAAVSLVDEMTADRVKLLKTDRLLDQLALPEGGARPGAPRA